MPDSLAGLVARENGRRDARMLPAAVAVWAATLVGLRWPDFATPIAAITAALAAAALCRAWARGAVGGANGVRHQRDGIGAVHAALVRPALTVGGQMLLHGLVVTAAVLCALAATGMHVRSERSDMLSRAVREQAGDAGAAGTAGAGTVRASPTARGGSVTAIIHATITAPAITSERHGHDCRYETRALAAAVGTETAGEAGNIGTAAPRAAAPTNATVRVYASGDGCAVTRGGTYRLTGTLSSARYGAAPLWLESDEPASAIRAPPPWHRVAAHMRGRFHAVTERLDDQGRILVPGLTLGVLGNEVTVPVEADAGETSVPAPAAPVPVDANVAQRIEDRFHDAGIMHLMAVSGGHFMVVAVLTRRLCGLFMVPRGAVAAALAVSYAALTALMQPSDSVLRAFAMGLLVAAAGIGGRPAQTLPALCWTVIGVLLVDPPMAASYGFALSAAAVLGLVLHAGRVESALSRHCPAPLAAAMSLTIAAQIYTLPIQVLMEPRLALHAVIANVLVAPFVTFATLAGLAALALAAVCEPLAYGCAWVASLGTSAMDTAARVVASLPFAVLPWAQGAAGVALLVALEAAVALLLRARARSGLRRMPGQVDDDGGGRDDVGVGAAGGGPRGAGAVRLSRRAIRNLSGDVPVMPTAPPTPFERFLVWWHDTWAMLG